MLLNSIKSAVGRYFKGSDSLQGQPLPEVNKALIEDAIADLELKAEAAAKLAVAEHAALLAEAGLKA